MLRALRRVEAQMSKFTPSATAFKPVSRLSTLCLVLSIATIWLAASTFVCDSVVGDGGPDCPVSSAFDLEGTEARSSPNEMEVMESSLTPRIGEFGLSGVTFSGPIFSATRVAELGRIGMYGKRLDLEKPCAS